MAVSQSIKKIITIIQQIFSFSALEIIPRQLCDNAGFDATNILNKLRQKHAQGNLWYGVDILNEDISDNYEVRTP